MRNKRNAKFFINILASKISLLALGGLTVWLGISVLKEANRKHEASDAVALLEAEKQDLEAKNADAAAVLGSLKDAGILELEAKRRLNLKKIGEEVAVILREKNGQEQSRGSEDSVEKTKTLNDGGEGADFPNPLKWWKYITGSE
ncbi:MAG: hypothetical protein HYS15_01340 [Candidatus Spechtbacteria bacterium]|nr:hypothetical protein [Candidatus Spechtbacteria bacterium]